MYYYLNGTVAQLTSDTAVIDCSGVGYLVYISSNTYEKLAGLTYADASGEYTEAKAKLYTYYSVKEDSADLFGFYTTEERDAFKFLISVSGVGPKSALSILSSLTVRELSLAVDCDDTRAISSANGIGAKTAQRITMELKGKLKNYGSYAAEKNTKISPAARDMTKEAISALKSLGFSPNEALAAVNANADASTLEELITRSLSALNKL